MREKNRKPIASLNMFPQFTTMNVIDGQAGVIIYSSLICYSLTIDNILNIIVILILAGVTVSTLTGDNGLLQKAQTAKEANEEAKELELIKLAVSAAQVAGEGNITKDNLENELKSNFDVDIINLDEKSGGWILNKNKEYTIYENGKVEEGNLLLLPKEYQQVEYIESSGTQYINTEYIPKINTELRLEVSFSGDFQSQSNNTTIFGEKDNDGMYGFTLNFGGHSSQGNNLYPWPNKVYGQGGSIHSFFINDDIRTNRNLIKMKSGQISYGTITNIIEQKTKDNDKSLYLFGGIESSNIIIPFSAYNMRLFTFKIFEGEILKKDFIPCYKKTTNTIGLYDLIEGKFYTNQGTGEFIAGPEV